MLARTLLVALAFAAPGLGATGFVEVSADSLPCDVYLDAMTVVLSAGPAVVAAEPGKHFVSLYPPAKVFRAAEEQAPTQFWDHLRSLGAIGDEYGLLASYEAGAVRAGTRWVYVSPDETLTVRLSRAEASRTYRKDSGCATRTFLGWVSLIGAAMVVSVILTTVNP
jgi:hypothetical protein